MGHVSVKPWLSVRLAESTIFCSVMLCCESEGVGLMSLNIDIMFTSHRLRGVPHSRQDPLLRPSRLAAGGESEEGEVALAGAVASM